MPFDRIQCADLAGWTGDPDAAGWRQVVSGIAELVGAANHPARRSAPRARRPQARHLRAAVRQHERRCRAGVFQRRDQRGHHHRFSPRSRRLSVISRNSTFQYKGKHIDLPRVARELNVSHVLEGSVRKAGGRVRITAQLINRSHQRPHLGRALGSRPHRHLCPAGRDLADRGRGPELELLPQEKKAIDSAGRSAQMPTTSHLMARPVTMSAATWEMCGARRRSCAFADAPLRSTRIWPRLGR